MHHPQVRSFFVAIVLTAAPALVHAGASSTTDVACGSTAAGVNLPAGAVGLSSGDGPIKAVITAIGEYRTHSWIYHGNGWATHSTMHAPGRPGWPTYCSTPLEPSELQNGYPGATQVNMGALYTFYYQPEGSPVEAHYFQKSPASGAGDAVQRWLWSSSNYAWVSSRQNSSSGFYRVGFDQTPYTQYSLYQYRDMQGIANGDGNTYNYGNVCSTYLAYAQSKSGNGSVSNSNSYDHGKVQAGLNAVYNSVESQCNNGTGFWDDFGAAITCFEGICDDAARQVTNCFADGINGRCYTDDDQYYRRVRDDINPPGPRNQQGYSIAQAVSPDAIGGWNGHGFGTAAPYPVWSWDGNNQVLWNSGGSVYGCFF